MSQCMFLVGLLTNIFQVILIKNIKKRSYFGEVADNVRSLFVDFSEDVEDKGLNVKIKRLVVEK